MSDTQRKLALLGAIVLIVGVIYLLQDQSAKPQNTTAENKTTDTVATKNSDKEKLYTAAKELIEPNGYLNTNSITISELIGKKVILVDFWTYSCINCQRTTPYLNSWYEKYKDAGFEIIGVHTPEFEFEKKYENVQRAIEKFEIKYPVVQDNEYKTWQAYGNRYWPRKYLIDIDGYIVYDHIGEGAYEETEEKIREALKEKSERLGEESNLNMPLTSNPVTTNKAASPEVYFGSNRNELLSNGTKKVNGKQILRAPTSTRPNSLYLVGSWDIQNEYAKNESALAKVEFTYKAQNVYTVASGSKEIIVEVRRDNKPLTKDTAGSDIYFENEKSFVKINEEQLYDLIKDTSESNQHSITLIPQDAGMKIFTFTFG